MEISTLFELKQQFAAREVGNELVIVPLSANVANMNELFTINETGKIIWQSITATSSVDDIAQILTQNFDIDHSTAKTDVNAFLQQMNVLRKYIVA